MLSDNVPPYENEERDIERLNEIRRITLDLSSELFPKLKHFNDEISFKHYGRHQSCYQEYFYERNIAC